MLLLRINLDQLRHKHLNLGIESPHIVGVSSSLGYLVCFSNSLHPLKRREVAVLRDVGIVSIIDR